MGDRLTVAVLEALFRQPLAECLNRIPSGGVQLEGAPHKWAILGVDLNRALPTIGSDESVASGWTMGPSSLQDFLAHALLDLLGEVRGVKLRNRRHNVLDQLPRNRFADVLDHRGQSDLVLLEYCLDHRVVID